MHEGIHCHNVMKGRKCERIDNPEVNSRRDKILHTGVSLHDYANLYINPRNAMMYQKIKISADYHANLAILEVNVRILDQEGVLVSDMNAATDAAIIRAPHITLPRMNKDEVYTKWFNTSDLAKAKSMAEVLVPRTVNPDFFTQVIVSGFLGQHRLERNCGALAIPIKLRFNDFFQTSIGTPIPKGYEL